MKVSFVSSRTIKIQADTLRSEYQDDYVTDIEGIATRKLGLSIHFFELQNLYGKGTLGMVLPDEKLILCEKFLEPHGKNKDNLERILRFTIAHEVGHYILHRRYMGDCESPIFHKNLPDKERQNLEVQANMFAAEVLMPEELFRKAYQDFTSNLESRDQTEIKNYLSSLFHISKDAVKHRMTALRLSEQTMKAIFKRISGVIILTFGLILAGWIFYNLFVERLPATQGRDPRPAIIFSAFLIPMGIKLLLAKKK